MDFGFRLDILTNGSPALIRLSEQIRKKEDMKKRKLRIGDKVSRIFGCSYSWRDQGVIISIARKKWLPYCPASDVAKMKNLAGNIVEVRLANLERI
jgi:hypothetical protein